MNSVDRRDFLIFGEEYKAERYNSGLRYFKSLRRCVMRQLIKDNIFNPYLWQRYIDYVWFMERYGDDNKLFLHGFVYSPDRKDGFSVRQGGISIEGIGRDEKWDDNEDRKMFELLFGDADQFELDPPYVWYD